MALSKKGKWLLNGGLGAVLFGSGLSLAIESGFWKHSSEPWYFWVLGGTAGIGLTLSGVILLIRTGILKRELETSSKK
ncbi:hypothetical protein [Flavimarina sp. Hel_I_48]|uniref:hypothetical protein n=1 Tax=Flavimarina sp. Hel_I_48 TaxID=1392488 RepID=UPI0004DF6518|nr:hypothetical protein [Flavimarina sp. Hel_I_48]